MDCSLNHLVDEKFLDALKEEDRKRYQPVPMHLQEHARRELARKSETTVSFHGAGALSDWARKERNKAKARRKQQKASRRGNR